MHREVQLIPKRYSTKHTKLSSLETQEDLKVNTKRPAKKPLPVFLRLVIQSSHRQLDTYCLISLEPFIETLKRHFCLAKNG